MVKVGKGQVRGQDADRWTTYRNNFNRDKVDITVFFYNIFGVFTRLITSITVVPVIHVLNSTVLDKFVISSDLHQQMKLSDFEPKTEHRLCPRSYYN